MTDNYHNKSIKNKMSTGLNLLSKHKNKPLLAQLSQPNRARMNIDYRIIKTNFKLEENKEMNNKFNNTLKKENNIVSMVKHNGENEPMHHRNRVKASFYMGMHKVDK